MILLASLVCFLLIGFAAASECPLKWSCACVRQQDELKVTCTFVPNSAVEMMGFELPRNTTHLVLRYSNLNKFPVTIFALLPKLKVIDFQSNTIAEMPYLVTQGKTIDLSKNPLNCDCNVHHFLNGKGNKVIGTCSHPSQMTGRPAIDTLNRLRCVPEKNTTNPEIVYGRNLTSSIVFIQWSASTVYIEDLLSYQVAYVPYVKHHNLVIKQITKDVNGAVLTGLETFTLYELYVRAVTRQGVGPWSEPFFLYTDDIVLTTAPSNLRVQDLDQNLFIVSWDEVDIGTLQGGLVSGCSVKITSNSKFRFIHLDVQSTSVVVDGLRYGTVYNVKVAYFSAKGTGPFSNPVYVRTPLASPCASHPCLNGATCTKDKIYLFNCSCLPKYSGKSCQHYTSGAPDHVTCTSPDVTLPNISPSIANANIAFKSKPLTITSRITTYCIGSTITSTVWRITPVGSPVVVYKANDKHSLVIPKRTLDYGRYMVRLTAQMKDFPVYNSAFGYIHVKIGAIVAIIKGGPKVVKKINGKSFILDASESNDLDTGTPQGLSFTWLCRTADQWFPNNTMYYPLVEKPVFFSGGESNIPFKRGGCYGTGAGRIPGNRSLLEFESYYIVVNTTYVFTLIVTSGNRRATFVQKIQVIPGSGLVVRISCLRNCHSTPDPNSKLALTAFCEDYLSSCNDELSYKWSAFYRNNSAWQEIKNLQDLIETPLTSKTLIFLASSLLPGKIIRVTLSVNRTWGEPGFAEYRFKVNVGPKKGYCSVTPKKGIALKTVFNFVCYNWTDPDQPIRYTFSYVTSEGVLHVLQKEVTSYLSVTLPPSDYPNRTVNVRIDISDSVGTYTTVYKPVKVTLDSGITNEELIDQLGALTIGSDSKLRTLIQQGRTGDALQLSRNVLLTLKESESRFSIKKLTEIKSTILKEVASIEVKSLKELGDTSSVIAQATSRVGDVSHDAEIVAAKALVRLTSVLEERGPDEQDYNTLIHGTERLVGGIGNVLQISSFKAESEKETNSKQFFLKGENFTSSHQTISRNLIDATEKIGAVVLSRTVVGEKPLVLKGDSAALHLSYEVPELMAGSRFATMDASFTFPKDPGELSKRKSALSSQMLVTNFTTFSWDDSSAKVSSLVLRLKIKDKSGSEILLKNLSSPVEIKLPQRVPKDEIENKTYLLGFGRIAYHKVEVKEENGSLLIKLIPQNNHTQIFLAVKFQERPKKDQDFIFAFPRETGLTNASLNSSNLSNTYFDRHTVCLGSPYITKLGTYFIGVRMRMDLDKLKANKNERTLRELKENFLESVGYKLVTSVSECLFWNDEEQKWISNGCKVSPKTTLKAVVCQCTHLTSFASQLYVAPNPIDFDKVFIKFTRLGETGNVMAFIVIACIFGMYVGVVLWARREDKKDQLKVGLKSFLGVLTPDSHQYQVSITTGIWRNSGTSAHVYIILHGDLSTSQPIHLVNSSCVPFSRGNTDTFVLSFQENLGNIKKIRIWHDNSGGNPSWFLSHVTIQGGEPGTASLFIFQQWLAVEKGAGFVDRTKNVATKNELKNFETSFFGQLSEQFANEHLWFSIFARGPNSPFTRVQRVTCCLSIILSIMVCDAMFYEFAPQPVTKTDPSIKVGPIRLKMRQFIIAIESALIIAPYHFLIAFIFQNVLPSTAKSIRTERLSFNKAKEREKVKRKKRNEGIMLPRIFVYVAYFLCFFAVLTSSTFIVFYSLFWGSYITNQWIISIIMALTLDIFIAKPFGLLVLAFVVSMVCHWRINELKNAQTLEQSMVFTLEDMDLNCNSKNCSFLSANGGEFKNHLQPPEPPNRQQLQKARRLQLMNEKLHDWLFDFVIFILYIGILFVVCYGSRDQMFFRTSSSIKNTFHCRRVYKLPDFWKWSEKVLLRGLYEDGKGINTDTKPVFILDGHHTLVGLPKITQKRVLNYNCVIVNQFKSILKNCTLFYSPTYEESRDFLPRWILSKSIPDNTGTNSTTSFQNAWIYSHSGIFLWSYVDYLRFYPRGGYVARLGHSLEETKRLFKDLEHHDWIDSKTVALFVSFTVYNPHTSLFSAVKIIFETKAAGSMEITHIVQPIHFYDFRAGYEITLMLFQLSLPIFIVYYIVKQIRLMKKELLAYFSIVFSWVEWIQICCTTGWMVIHVYKMIQIDVTSKSLTENIFKDNDFDVIVMLNDIENTLLALMIFFNTMKLLLILQFSHIRHFFGILRSSFTELLTYTIFLGVTMFSFAIFALLIFGGNIQAYSDLFKTLSQLCHIVIGGKLNFDELRNANRILGPFFFLLFTSLSLIFFVNVIILILIHHYGLQIEKLRCEYGLGRYIVDRLKEACGFGKTVVPEKWSEMDEIRLQCHFAKILDLSETQKLIKRKKKYLTFIDYKSLNDKNSLQDDSGKRYEKYNKDYCDSIEEGDEQQFWKGTVGKQKPSTLVKKKSSLNLTNKDIPVGSESAVEVKLHRMGSLINVNYAGEFGDDMETVLLGIKTNIKPKENLPQSITEIFGC